MAIASPLKRPRSGISAQDPSPHTIRPYQQQHSIALPQMSRQGSQSGRNHDATSYGSPPGTTGVVVPTCRPVSPSHNDGQQRSQWAQASHAATIEDGGSCADLDATGCQRSRSPSVEEPSKRAQWAWLKAQHKFAPRPAPVDEATIRAQHPGKSTKWLLMNTELGNETRCRSPNRRRRRASSIEAITRKDRLWGHLSPKTREQNEDWLARFMRAFEQSFIQSDESDGSEYEEMAKYEERERRKAERKRKRAESQAGNSGADYRLSKKAREKQTHNLVKPPTNHVGPKATKSRTMNKRLDKSEPKEPRPKKVSSMKLSAKRTSASTKGGTLEVVELSDSSLSEVDERLIAAGPDDTPPIPPSHQSHKGKGRAEVETDSSLSDVDEDVLLRLALPVHESTQTSGIARHYGELL